MGSWPVSLTTPVYPGPRVCWAGEAGGKTEPSDPRSEGESGVLPRSPRARLRHSCPGPLSSRPRPRAPREAAHGGSPGSTLTLPQGQPAASPWGRGGAKLSAPPAPQQGGTKARPSPHRLHLLVWGLGWQVDAIRGPHHRRPSSARPSLPRGQDGPARSRPLHQGPEACLHGPAEGSHLHGRGSEAREARPGFKATGREVSEPEAVGSMLSMGPWALTNACSHPIQSPQDCSSPAGCLS